MGNGNNHKHHQYTAGAVDFYSARLRAAADSTWLFAAIMSTLGVEKNIDTAAIDEWWRIYWDRKFFAGLKIEQAAAVVVHEIWHVLRFHSIRARECGENSGRSAIDFCGVIES